MDFASPWNRLREQQGFPEPLLEAVTMRLGFNQMTPVQDAVIPLLCQEKDVAAQAETGSGKTLAYLVPALAHVSKSYPALWTAPFGSTTCLSVHTLILAPTHVLARQIYEVAIRIVDPSYIELVIGGSRAPEEVRQSETKTGLPHVTCRPIIVGTIGILDYYIASGILSVDALRILILDEADRIISVPAFSMLLTRLPSQRRTWLFSATFDGISAENFRKLMRNPHLVKLTADKKEAYETEKAYIVPRSLKIWYCIVPYQEKVFFLLRYIDTLRIRYLRSGSISKLIVFFLTCASAEYFTQVFQALYKDTSGITLRCFTGQQSAEVQQESYGTFLSTPAFSVLFTTDVSARGLDIPEVDNVLQFDPPTRLATYTHRAGRTARCFRTGSAGLLLSPEELGIVKLLRDDGIPMQSVSTDEILLSPDELMSQGGLDPTLFTPPQVPTLLEQKEFQDLQNQLREAKRRLKEATRVLEKNRSRVDRASNSVHTPQVTTDRMRDELNEKFLLPVNRQREELEKFMAIEKAEFERRGYMQNHPLTIFLRRRQLADREAFELCQTCFNTWLNGYQNHEARLIFRLTDLPIGEYGNSLGLLKLPASKILTRIFINFQSSDVIVNDLQYANPQKEAQRIALLAKQNARKEQIKTAKSTRRPGKSEEERERAIQNILTYGGRRADGRFANEVQLLKMLDQGRITEEEFDRLIDDVAHDTNLTGRRRKV
ncbi:ATP-dependent RNA helicase [Giardia muris]|uniref:ATP-dependent RNA helicase n=1 Tax=Giardia muris TaxID=5742 RepID=A0A4Z1SS31_GIAMU|nr:ATP-dependent RNA helicase [Giardia muris]|eukprot:TNJ28732.1 ATP-dependent RNA helicase [Giardia muris]